MEKAEKERILLHIFFIGDICLADIVPVFDPNPADAYNDIRNNMARWVEQGIDIRKHYY